MVADQRIIDALEKRDGVPTLVTMRNGTELVVHNIAWGYDDGDHWAHVTTNISPNVESGSVDFFLTSDVVRLCDASSGDVLHSLDT